MTEVFPEKEPLRFSIREKANQILADLLCGEQKKQVRERILGNIEVLKGYFEVAEAQKWLPGENFLVLKREYDKIIKEIFSFQKKKDPEPKDPKPSDTALNNLANERCKKILGILKQKEKAQTWEIKKIFPEVTKRTLRRDLDYLLETGLIQRVGQGNDTCYKLGRTR